MGFVSNYRLNLLFKSITVSRGLAVSTGQAPHLYGLLTISKRSSFARFIVYFTCSATYSTIHIKY